MKVVGGKFATGVDLIVCAISDYYVASLWVNGKDEIQSNSLKTNIILLIEIMLLLRDRKSTRLNSSHPSRSRMPSSA